VTLPLSFFLTGLVALAVGVVWLVADPDILAAYHYNQNVIAATHLFVLETSPAGGPRSKWRAFALVVVQALIARVYRVGVVFEIIVIRHFLFTFCGERFHLPFTAPAVRGLKVVVVYEQAHVAARVEVRDV
jgi:hypothetical protein